MEVRRDVFQAIADPTRRAILTLLAVQTLTPGAIADHFETKRQTVSKHIRILAECELLSPQTKGREIYYQLNPTKMKEISDFLEPFRALMESRFAQLDDVLTALQKQQ